jgi:ABC-type multidrug transport system ATPase subunit
MLKVESLSAEAGNFQLRNVDLNVKEGECHAVLGPSGSGKSTLLNAILGMLPSNRGSIRLGGADITPAIERAVLISRCRLGYSSFDGAREHHLQRTRPRSACGEIPAAIGQTC